MFSNPYVEEFLALPALISTYALTMISHCEEYVSYENSLISRPCSVAMDPGKPMQSKSEWQKMPDIGTLGLTDLVSDPISSTAVRYRKC